MGGLLAALIVVGASLSAQARRRLLVGTLAAGALGSALFWESLLSFKRDQHLDEALTAESARLRPLLATVAWQMFLDYPLLGVGFGQYLQENGPYLADRSIDLPLEKARPYVQHNVVLALLVETGAIGAGLFLVLLSLWARDALLVRRRSNLPLGQRQLALVFLAGLAAYLANGMFQDVSIIVMVNMLLFLLAGLTNSLAQPAAVRPASAAAGWTPATRPGLALG
jgi:O-antigen ligase